MALRVKFKTQNDALTIKSSAAATKVTNLTDVDQNGGSVSGSTLVYNADTKLYVSEKVFNYDGEDVSLDGGTF